MSHAIIYLDTLDLVTFDCLLVYSKARHVANHSLRPYLSLKLRDRDGRKVWCTSDVHYFDPVRASMPIAHQSRS
jgi:hypothetical protein